MSQPYAFPWGTWSKAWLVVSMVMLTMQLCWRDVVPGLKPVGPSQRAGGALLQALAWLPDDFSLAAMDCYGNLALFNMNGCLQTLSTASTAALHSKVYKCSDCSTHMHLMQPMPCRGEEAMIAMVWPQHLKPSTTSPTLDRWEQTDHLFPMPVELLQRSTSSRDALCKLDLSEMRLLQTLYTRGGRFLAVHSAGLL